MPRPRRWVPSKIVDGIGTFELSSWKWLHDFISQEMLDYTSYIYRGQRQLNWKLEPTIDRIIIKDKRLTKSNFRKRHLDRFKLAVRGRRGANPQQFQDENFWWALGQHHGLITPLLDWTESPFVAAFFAFEKDDPEFKGSRVIYALSRNAIIKKSKEIQKEYTDMHRPPITEIISPLLEDNARLVNQRGLFTRSPDGVDLEKWVRTNFQNEKSEYILIKIAIPNTGRDQFLRALNRMNISHLSLFPDVYGSSQFCNMFLDIKNY